MRKRILLIVIIVYILVTFLPACSSSQKTPQQNVSQSSKTPPQQQGQNGKYQIINFDARSSHLGQAQNNEISKEIQSALNEVPQIAESIVIMKDNIAIVGVVVGKGAAVASTDRQNSISLSENVRDAIVEKILAHNPKIADIVVTGNSNFYRKIKQLSNQLNSAKADKKSESTVRELYDYIKQKEQ